MRNGFSRTVAAGVLTAVAVAVPCGAWFYVGQKQIAQERESSRELVYSQSYKRAVMLAERLATRLELLRSNESRRPFYHYQNLYHDPKGASEGASVVTSPLAQGPVDPMVEAHFQVDAEGNLTLPTLNDAFPELGLQGAEDRQCELLWKLHDIAVFCKLESGRLPGGSRWSTGGGDDLEPAPEGEARSLEIDAQAWRQHLQANDVWAKLKYDDSERPPEGVSIAGRPLAGVDLSGGRGEPGVQVDVYPMEWHSLPMGGEPALVGLRRVTTPAGEWTQGFVVDREAVGQLLDNSYAPTTFRPMEPGDAEGERAGRVSVPVEGTPWASPWRVELDIESQLAATREGVATDAASFYRSFAFGSLAAGIAGLLVIAMVFQSERLAQQRIQFAASAAHELRTPLAGLRLYGEMLADGLGTPERSRDYARRLAAEAERLGRVVTNVLSFTRLERGNIPVHAEEGDLRQAVLEAFERHRPALEESGAEVEVHTEDVPTVAFDRDALVHILQNLLDNAEKYTRGIPGRRIVVELAQESKRVVLSVADNGRGIPRKVRKHLFRPFSRGEATDDPEGLGLGLVLVKMLVQAQGAEISYRDAPEGGAVFRVAFPAVA